MNRPLPLQWTSGLLLVAGILASCSGDRSTAVPEPRVVARLLVEDASTDPVVVRLDSSALGGVEVEAEVTVVSHPWDPDSVVVEKHDEGYWSIAEPPDGPWTLRVVLRDGTGRVRAEGRRSFARVRPLTVCSHPMTFGEWVGLLGGNLVVVAGLDEAARSGRDVVQAVLAAMALGPVDFSNLEQLHTRFSNGVYSYGSDPDRVETRFAFVAAQAFGSYAAGDTLRENVSNVSSFVKNLDFSITKGVTWDRGPLFGLIQGSVDVGRSLVPSFSIDHSRLSITLATRVQENRARRSFGIEGDSIVLVERTPDSLALRIALPPMTIGALKTALQGGTLVFGHDGTTYASEVDGIRQAFHDSRIVLFDDTLGRAQFHGSYAADAASGGLSYHHLGTIRSDGPQSTLFSCDADFLDTLGVAHHDADLAHGRFVTVRHDTIPYALVPY